ncbi:hypothetical protein VI26_07860 [Chromobacterium sp. LK1]|uniref:hypothetical protein n=1 Tax=Chromobacterium sp. LK1 TaxID=1628193 RepID=UPI00065403BF|nr:hypothetical protein [Chromobacterium sp. LK1]KMN36189.1 hypothetical protein VI26_07860 [Chromobacterium sp. LK1]
MTYPRALSLLSILLLLPQTCLADMAGLGLFLINLLLIGAAVWLLLSGLLFYALRRRKPRARFGLSLLFLLAPLLWLGLQLAAGFFIERLNPVGGETADSPVTLAGVSFPAGSHIVYEQDNGSRQPVKAESSAPLALGPLSIVSLKQEPGSRMLEAGLSGGQEIEGWPCASAEVMPTTLEPTPQGPRLQGCWLGRPRELGAVRWPPGSVLSRDGQGNWSLFWQADQAGEAFGLPVDNMTASYSPRLSLLGWEGSVYGIEFTLGDYRFSGLQSSVKAKWQSDGSLRLSGDIHRRGQPVSCVIWRPEHSQARAC